MKKTLLDVEVAGVTDKPFGDLVRPTDPTQLAMKYKLASAVTIASSTAADLRQIFTANTMINGLAESFALIELAICENLCNSIAAPVGLNISLDKLAINGGNYQHGNDEHYTSAFVSVLLNTKLYHALGACLIELVEVLKSRNMFANTVIQVGAEFNRSPLSTGVGSDHGYQGGCTTIISGKVQGPLIIGNITNNPTSNFYPGTWGWAAPSIAGRKIDLADVANAISLILGTPPVLRRNEALIELQNGTVVSKIGLGKQV